MASFGCPGSQPADAPIRRGPNIRPLPEIEAIPSVLEGSVIIKVGDNVTTDHIVPAGAHYLPIRSNIPELAKHVFKVVDESFPERAKQAGGGFIVAGENYGQGSSREQAALAPRYLGIRAVIARSFARIHLANLVNFGILPIVFTRDADAERVAQGDRLSIETGALREGQSVAIRNVTRGETLSGEIPLPQDEIDIATAGGRLNRIRLRRPPEG